MLKLLFFIFSSVSAFATEGSLPSQMKNYPREIMFSRHDIRAIGVRNPNDHQVRQQTYNEVNGLFVGGSISSRMGFGFRSCETLLNSQQGFAIGKYGDTSYLEKEEAEFYRKLGANVSPDQVAYLEVLRVVPAGDPVLNRIQERNRTPDYYHGGPTELVRSASFWSVAGQRLSPRMLKTELTKVPWQLEPEWAEASARIDRNKIKLWWEWGRAASDLPNEIAPLYSANALANLKEVIAGNADIDSAYVTFHSLDEKNTRLYDLYFPGSRLATKSESNVLYLVPLRKALERFPPSKVSKPIADIKAMIPQIDDIDIVRIISEFRDLFWDELDLYNGNELLTVPIVANEWSQIVISHSLIGILMKYRVPESLRVQVANYLIRNVMPNHHTTNLGQYMDVVDMPTSTAKLFQTDTLQLSNIPKEVGANPKMLLRILIGAYYYKLRQLTQYGFESKYKDTGRMHQGLTEQNYKIAISTWDKTLGNRLQSFGGDLQTVEMPKSDFTPSDEELNRGEFWMFRAHHQPMYIVSFSIQTLTNIANAHPQIDDEAKDIMGQGWHQIYYKLRQMELM